MQFCLVKYCTPDHLSVEFTQLKPTPPPDNAPPTTRPSYVQWKTLEQADLPLADVDGDGRADLIVWGYMSTTSPFVGPRRHLQRIEVFRQTDTGFERYAGEQGVALLSGTEGDRPKGARVADLNQDGLSDLVYFVGKWYKKKGNYRWRGTWQYRFSTGDGFTDAEQLLAAPLSDPQMPSSPSLYDDNGDGYPDFLYHDVPARALRVLHFLPGTGAFATAPTRVRTTDGKDDQQFFTADMNGDGNSDLLHVPVSDNGTERLDIYLHNSATRPHLVTAISNGLGAATEMRYASLGVTGNYVRHAELYSTPEEEQCFSDWQVGAKAVCWIKESKLEDADAFYKALNDPWDNSTDPLPDSLTATAGDTPVLELTGPLYVVTRVDSSAPTAADATAKSGIGYVYERGKVQAAGRGMLGFRALTTVDLQTGVRTTTTYRQDFPYIGLPLSTEVKTLEGMLLRTSGNEWRLKGYQSTWNARTVGSGTGVKTGSARLGALQPYIRESVETVYDLPGTVDGTLTNGKSLHTLTTVTDVDTWGNPTNITATTEDHANTKKFQQVTENIYGADSSTWEKQYGRLTKSTVTHRRDEDNDGTYETTGERSSSFTYYTNGHKKGLLRTAVRDAITDGSKTTVPAHTTTYDYDKFGNRIRVAVSAGGITRCNTNTVVYDSYGRFVVQEMDCLSRPVRTISKYNAHGLPLQSEQVVGVKHDNTAGAVVRTTYSYTDGGRLYFTHTAAGTYTGQFRAACKGVTHCPTGAAYYTETHRAGGAKRWEYRDRLDRVVRTRVAGFKENTWIHTDTEYDHLGRVARTSTPYYAAAPTTRAWTTHSYDLLGRVVKTTLPDYATDSNGVVTVNSLITQTHSKLSTTTTNGKGQRTTETRNALGEVISTADHAGTTVTHSYDAWGQVTGTTTAGTGVSAVTVSTTYDGRGRRTGVTDPDRGTWTYAWNGFDELVKQTDAVGNEQVLTYDALGRLASRKDYAPDGEDTDTQPDLEGDVTWTYDPPNGLGQLHTVSDSVSGYTRRHSYDTLGRVSVTATTVRTGALASTEQTWYSKQTYDAYARPYQTFDAARQTETFTDNVTEVRYNDRGYAYQWVDGVVDENNDSRQTYRTITAQDARGNVTGEKLGGGAVRTSRAFDAKTGRIQSITGEKGIDDSIQTLMYEWDLLGNLHKRGETSLGKMRTETFTYDTLNRLTKAQVAGQAAQTVSYDALGNIMSKTGVGSYTYGAGSAGRHAVTRIGTDTYTYDANGNQVSGPGRTLTYTAFNKVASIDQGDTTTTAFVYGPDRARIKRTDTFDTGDGTSTTTTVYLGNVEQVIAEDGSYTYKRYLADGILIEQTHDIKGKRTGETTRHLLYDHLGSVDVITDDMGTVLQDLSFDAWGQRRAPDDWTILALLEQSDTTHGRYTTRGYTGHEMLDAVGIIHMNGRIYDPKLGRFLQADPVIQFPHYSQGQNRYSYVLNNPLTHTDPTGYFIGKLFNKLFKGVNKVFGDFSPFVGIALLAIPGMQTWVMESWLHAFQFGFLTGGIGAGSFEGALFGGISTLAFVGIGSQFVAETGFFQQGGLGHVLTHGLAGGILAELQGGQFGHGFLAAGLSKAVMGRFSYEDGSAPAVMGRTAIAAIVGGTVSRITGGKFANGALTAAMAQLFNAERTAREQAALREQSNRIELSIGYTDTPVGVGNHALVIATDPITGEQYATRAGPRLNDQGGCCIIEAVYGEYNSSFRDAPSSVHTTQNIGSLDISLAEFASRAGEFANITNANRIPYLGITSNSNSYAFTFARSLGFSPKPTISAPGWKAGKPSPELSYR